LILSSENDPPKYSIGPNNKVSASRIIFLAKFGYMRGRIPEILD
jgi:hypothetical protein